MKSERANIHAAALKLIEEERTDYAVGSGRLTFDPNESERQHKNTSVAISKIATRTLFIDYQLRLSCAWFGVVGAAAHLDGAGVVLRAAHHARGSVEAGGRLEGDGQVVGLRDVLHGGRVGVRLHDGRQLKGQHQWEQLLQDGGTGGQIDSETSVREAIPAGASSHFQPKNFTELNFWFWGES